MAVLVFPVGVLVIEAEIMGDSRVQAWMGTL